MNDTQVNQLISILEGGLLSEFVKVASIALGYEPSFEIKKRNYSWSGYVVTLEETGHETTQHLLSTNLTRLMFDEAKVGVRVGYNEDSIYFSADIHYHHPLGGSNGIDLFKLEYSIAEKIFTKVW